jgi:hypothetical protein
MHRAAIKINHDRMSPGMFVLRCHFTQKPYEHSLSYPIFSASHFTGHTDNSEAIRMNGSGQRMQMGLERD